jgi:hypothetical protein
MDDETPDPLAAFDQAIAGMKDFARMLMAHTRACEDEGYTRQEAMRLTVAYQTSIMASWSPE